MPNAYTVERRDTSSGGGAFYRVEGRFYGLERRGNMRILYMENLICI